MNKSLNCLVFAAALLAGIWPAASAQAPTHPGPPHQRLSPPPSAAPSAIAQDKKTSAGEAFFIVASVDQSKSQVLLKRPTEVTLLVNVDAKTQFLDDSGNPLKITDFRAGDTVWLTASGGADQPTAVRIRKGQMTVAELHHSYLDYPEIK